MKRFIQWDENGQINEVRVMLGGDPIYPRQLQIDPDIDLTGKMIDIKTLELIDAPIPEPEGLSRLKSEWPYEKIIAALDDEDQLALLKQAAEPIKAEVASLFAEQTIEG